MYLVELTFDDDPRRLEARPAHRERLLTLQADGVLVIAGPWEDDSGAALVFDTDRAGVDAIIDADPYYRAPGVQVTSVRAWTPIAGTARPE